MPFHQIEGITTTDGLEYALTNERLSQVLMIPQRLHYLDLSEYVEGYLEGLTGVDVIENGHQGLVVASEAGVIILQAEDRWMGQPVRVVDLWGRTLVEVVLVSPIQRIKTPISQPAFLVIQVGSTVKRVMVW